MITNFSAQNNSPLLQIPAGIFCAVTPLVVGARFWSRRRTNAALGGDDWTILGSMVFALADCTVQLVACSFGFGKHSASLSVPSRIMALKLFLCSQILYKIGLNLTKVSILLLYLRAFTLRPFRITCWALMAIVVLYGIGATVATILQCVPIARTWDKSVAGSCFNLTAFWYTNASYAIGTDLFLLVLPIRVIWSLHLRPMQKIAVMLAFALGGLVTVCSIIRMTTLTTSSTSTDPTYDIASTSWANIESNMAILCACLPVFRRPLALLFPRLFSSLGDPSAGEALAGEAEPGNFSLEQTDMSNVHWIEKSDFTAARSPPHEGKSVERESGAAARGSGSHDLSIEHVEHVSREIVVPSCNRL